MSQFHTSVMPEQCLHYLNIQRGGIFVDATLGGGGHSLLMLKVNPNIRLYCFDQDAEALEYAKEVLAEYQDRVELIHSNFSEIRTQLSLRKVNRISGVLFDLGVSSHQIDDKTRGFSFDGNSDLDMRMDRRLQTTAYDIINSLSSSDLHRIFKEYGEELAAKKIAQAIDKARLENEIQTTKQLTMIIDSVIKGSPQERTKSKARIFQAIRIYLNRELDVLQSTLEDTINILEPGARIVVMSYHSLEDRIVKQAFRSAAQGCDCPAKIMKCVCNKTSKLKVLTSRPIIAEEEEIKNNSRARSAKLRAAERIREEM